MSIKSTICLKSVVLKSRLLLVCAALIFATYSFARCGQQPIEEHFEKSDAVFTATVNSIEDAPEEYSRRQRTVDGEVLEIPQFEVRFQVEDVWKGELDEEVLVYTGNGPIHIQNYPFQVKRRYVVFAYFNAQVHYSEETEKHLRTMWCSGNIGLGESESDVDLGELPLNVYHSRHGELEDEAALVERLEDLRSKLEDSFSSEEAEEDTNQ